MFWSGDSEPDLSEGGEASKKAPAKVVEEEEDGENVAPIEKGDLGLKVTKLWARVDELETRMMKQKERVHLLERGLITGLVPEGFQDKYLMQKSDAGQKAFATGNGQAENMRQKQPGNNENPDTVSGKQEMEYRQALSSAAGLFSALRYGEAIQAYEKIGRDYPAKLTRGSHLYWIALCWFRLKEYDTARRFFNDLVNQHSTNPWVPKAWLQMARMDFRQGYSDQSLRKLKRVIKQYPEDEAATMARLEIKHIEEAL